MSDSEQIFKGWVEQVRTLAKVVFIDLYLGGSPDQRIQVVVSGTKSEIKSLKLDRHCAIEVTGKLVDSPGSEQSQEVKTTPSQVKIIGTCDQDSYPIAKTDLTLDYLRAIPMWRSRTKTFRSVFTVRDLVTRAIHKFFKQIGYTHIHTPLITKSDCEGAGETFRLVTSECDDYFGTQTSTSSKSESGESSKRESDKSDEPIKAYLTVSGQLQAEIMAAAMGPVYTFGPTFRAEKSKTSRHLSEFWMVEPEVPYLDLDGLVGLSVSFLKFIVSYVLERAKPSLEILTQHSPDLITKLETFVQSDPVVITYTEAITRLTKAMADGVVFQEKPEWGIDLGSEHETWLCGDKLTIITHYPRDIKAFYMYETDDCEPDRETVECMDVLLPGIGEVIGGSRRESRFELLIEKMEELGLGGPEYDFYRDLRRYGYLGSSGFGLGFERMVRYVTGMSQIRDVIPFPVSYGKLHT